MEEKLKDSIDKENKISDEVIENLSYIIGSALNAVLNPTLELEGL